MQIKQLKDVFNKQKYFFTSENEYNQKYFDIITLF